MSQKRFLLVRLKYIVTCFNLPRHVVFVHVNIHCKKKIAILYVIMILK